MQNNCTKITTIETYLMFRIDALACLSIAKIQWNYGIFKGTDDPSGTPV